MDSDDFAGAMKFGKEACAVADASDEERLAERLLTGVALRYLDQHEAKYSDVELAQYAESVRGYPIVYGDVRSSTLLTLARRRSARGDLDGSASAMREAVSTASSVELRHYAERSAASLELYRLSRGGACDEFERQLTKTTPMADAERLRAQCHAVRAKWSLMKGDMPDAEREFRVAKDHNPGETSYQLSLAFVLAKKADGLVRGSRCRDARPLLAEGRALAPKEPYFISMERYCATQ